MKIKWLKNIVIFVPKLYLTKLTFVVPITGKKVIKTEKQNHDCLVGLGKVPLMYESFWKLTILFVNVQKNPLIIKSLMNETKHSFKKELNVENNERILKQNNRQFY